MPPPVFHHHVRPAPLPPPPRPRIIYPAPLPRHDYYRNYYRYPKSMHSRDWTIFGLSLFSDLLTASVIANGVSRPAVVQPPAVYTIPAPAPAVVSPPVQVTPSNNIIPGPTASSITVLPSPPMVIEEKWLVYPDGTRVRVK